jgi:hypothetical protein
MYLRSSLGLLKRHGFLTQKGLLICRLKGVFLNRYRYNLSSQAVLLKLGLIGLMKNWWIINLIVEVLQEARVFEAIVISRGLNMYRDVAGTRHLVRRWCPATHAFFLAWGEFTVTIEDVANLLMLPILGDIDPTRLRLTAAESMIEEELIEGFGGKGASFGGHLAKHSTWVITFRKRSDESKKYVRRAAFVAF